MFKSRLYLLILVVPAVILFVSSLSKSYADWQAYTEVGAYSTKVETLKQYKLLEYAFSSEVTCRLSLTTENESRLSAVCRKMQQMTDRQLRALPSGELSHFDIIRKDFYAYKENPSNLIAVQNNPLQKRILGDLKHLLSITEVNSEKMLLTYLIKSTNTTFAVGSEKAFIAYYLGKKEPIKSQALITWDKLVQHSALSYATEEAPLAVLQSAEKMLHAESYKEIEKKLDSVRIDIMGAASNGTFQTGIIEWVELLNQKQKVLKLFESKLVESLENSVHSRLVQLQELYYRSMLQLLVWLLLLSIVIYVLVLLYQNEKSMQQLLTKVNFDRKNREMKTSNDIGNRSYKERYNFISHHLEDLDTYEQKLIKQKNEKEEILASMSHEVRTPLNGILGFVEVLEETELSAKQIEYLSTIKDSSSHLIAVVNNILDISKLDASKMKLEASTFDFVEKMEFVVDLFTPQANQKDIELSLYVDPSIEHFLVGDPTKLTQVTSNLVSNAIKFTPVYGKINIDVISLEHDEGMQTIRFSIQDTGIGIDKAEHDKIFEPFSQAEQQYQRVRQKGTGLGLSISKEIIKLMGGDLAVESQKGKGSNFYFSLTFPVDQNYPAKQVSDYTSLSVGLALPVKKVVRHRDETLKRYLSHLGSRLKIYYYEEIFKNGFEKEKPDILLVDHQYARLEGELESFSSIGAYVVLMTSGTLYSRVNPNIHTFADIVHRPLSLEKLTGILERHLAHCPQVSEQPEPAEETEVQAPYILVVDDNRVNQKLMKTVLEKQGYRVDLASDGAEAYKLCQNGTFDMVFMDINMPNMDGVEATKKIRAYEKEHGKRYLPIVALTANQLRHEKEDYIKAGMDGYSPKPIKLEAVKSYVEKFKSKSKVNSRKNS